MFDVGYLMSQLNIITILLHKPGYGRNPIDIIICNYSEEESYTIIFL